MRVSPAISFSLLLVLCNWVSSSTSVHGIQWGQCAEEFEGNRTVNVTILCARLPVPLDYTNSSSKQVIELQLLRAPAVKQPSKGSILFNFGGPGQISRNDLVQRLDVHIPVTGYEYDLVTIDPRGTGTTLTSSCYGESELALLSKYSAYTNSSDTALGENWSKNGMIAEICYLKNKEIGSFLGTAFVARDLISVVNALDEDGMLRFWGHSYGTVLGATVAAMFPEKVDRMVLDGVINSHEYYHAYDLEWLTDTDRVWSGFFEGCIAAPHNCALARNNMTAAELETEFYDFLYQLKYAPLVTLSGQLVTYEVVKGLVVATVYNPNLWAQVATVLQSLYEGNGTSAIISESLGVIGDTTTNADESIKCADKTIRTPTMEGMMNDVHAKYKKSRLVGDAYVPIDFECAQWKMQAKEIYMGNFQTKTKTPIMFVSNFYDPMAPLISAKNMTSSFEDSVLLEQVAYGHGVFSQPSVCAINAIQNYLVYGILPNATHVCNSQQDVPLFSTKNATDVLKQLEIQPPPGYKI